MALISLVAGVGAVSSAAAQPDLVVTAEDLRERASAYVQEVALAPSDQLYARWDDRICPSVTGLEPGEAQTLIDHIAVRANEVGVRTGREGCRQNVVMIFAPDADALAREIVDTRRDLLGDGQDDVQTSGEVALEQFASVPRAVRWWHVSYTVTSDGRRLRDTGTNSGQGSSAAAGLAAQAGEGGSSMPGQDAGITRSTDQSSFTGLEGVRSDGSRLSRPTRRDMGFVLVLVDMRRIADVPPAAVADYLAMASLVQLDPNASLGGYPTILNLFASDTPTATAWTDWDSAFVRSLYSGPRDSATARQQRAAISRRIAGELRD